MIFSIRKRALAGFLSLTMLGTMVASVPFTASAADYLNAKVSIFENKGWSSSTSVVGKANKKLYVEAIKAALTGDDADGATITYKGYENKKWLTGSNNKAIGNANKKLAFEAVSFKLSDVEGYSISYSVYENKTWYTGKDGSYAGKANKGYKIEAIKIKVTETAPADLTISSVAALADVPVDNGTTADAAIALLPTTVSASLSDGTADDAVPVQWTAPTGFDGKTAGTYAFTGTLNPTDETNPDGITATVNVVVGAVAVASVVPTTDNIAIGGSTTFTFKDATGATMTAPTGVTYALEDATAGAIDSTGKFVASKSGAIKVDVTIGSTKLVATVNVFGVATAIKLTSASSTLVANDTSTDVITVTAVDANGIPVSNYSGTATIGVSNAGAFTLSATQPSDVAAGVVTLTNGVGTFSVTAGQIPSLTANATVTSAISGTSTAYTVAVSTIAQVATKISVTAPTSIPVNSATNSMSGTSLVASATVIDQTGNTMLTGVYPVTFHIAGSSVTFYVGSAATTTDQTGIIIGNTPATVGLQSVLGISGATTVTATSGTLSGTATINGVVTGAAVKYALTVDSASSSSFAQVGGSTVFDVTAVDASGNTVPTAGTPTVKLFANDGVTATTNLTTTAIAGGKFTVSASTAGAYAGTYDVQVTDNGNVLGSSALVPVTVTAGPANKIAVSAAASYVPASAPTTTVSAQVEDQYGNPVADSGASVVFSAVKSVGPAGVATIGGIAQDGTTATNVTAKTDATGKATVSFSAQTYSAAYTVSATVTGFTTATTIVTVTPMTTSKIGLTITDIQAGSNYNTQTGIASAGDALKIDATQQDAYGNTIPAGEDDSLTVTVTPATGLVNLPSSWTVSGNTATYTGNASTVINSNAFNGVKAGVAGVLTISVKDNTNPAATGSASITLVAANTASSVRALSPVGTTASYTVSAAGEIGPFTIQLVDAGGNPSVSAVPVVLSLTQVNNLLSGTGLTAVLGTVGLRTSANGSDATTLTIPAGTSQIQVWLNVTTAGVVVPTSSVLATILPAGTPTTSIVDNSYINANVTPTIGKGTATDTLTAKLDGVAYTTGTAITTEAAHVLTIVETNGLDTKTVTVHFTIDKTAPAAVVKAGSTANSLGLTITDATTVTVAVVTGGTVADATVAAGAATITSATGATDGQTINLTLTDAAGNVKTYTATFTAATTSWALS
jgi:hypothetical protein